MTTPPKEGIYYVTPTPNGWELLAKPFARGEELDHGTWWEETVAAKVAAAWVKTLSVHAKRLAAEIGLHPYAFPRGRVSRAGDSFLVVHGADLKPAMKVSKRKIEECFGIVGKCDWLFDEHEQCQLVDQETVCGVLGIRPTWSAV